jgi:hypothetical protein
MRMRILRRATVQPLFWEPPGLGEGDSGVLVAVLGQEKMWLEGTVLGIQMYMYMNTCMYTYIYICIYMCIHTGKDIYVYVYICVYIQEKTGLEKN